MARKTQLDRAIEKIDGEIAVLQAARARLVEEQMDRIGKKSAQSVTDPRSTLNVIQKQG